LFCLQAPDQADHAIHLVAQDKAISLLLPACFPAPLRGGNLCKPYHRILQCTSNLLISQNIYFVQFWLLYFSKRQLIAKRFSMVKSTGERHHNNNNNNSNNNILLSVFAVLAMAIFQPSSGFLGRASGLSWRPFGKILSALL